MEKITISPANGKKIKTNGKLIGTCFNKKNNKYMSCTKKDGKFIFLGYYETELSSAKTEEDIIKLNHYTNLQWLIKKDNRNKRDNIDFTLTKILI